MLEHVGQHDEVERALDLLGQPLVEVGGHEVIDPLLHTVVGPEVDPGHVVAEGSQLTGQVPVGTADVEHPTGRRGLEPAQQDLV